MTRRIYTANFYFTVVVTISCLTLVTSAIVPAQHSRHHRAAAEYKPTNEAEPTGNQPNSTVEPEPEPEAESWPEPGPKWSEAYKTWKSAWEIHVYLFATSYLIMGFYAAYYVGVNLYDGLEKRYLSFSLNVMVLVFCLTRAFVMYLDPYHQGGIIKALQLMRIIWSIGGPCLTASDSLIILAILESSHLRITIPALQKGKVISLIIALHFVFILVTDFVVSLYVSAKGMILFCQTFYVVWGSLLGLGYIKLGYVLGKQLFGHKPHKDKRDKIYVWLIYASGVANFFLVVITFYTMFGVFGVYSDVKFVNAWSWWGLQTAWRISEVATCILIFTVSAKRTRIEEAIEDIGEGPQITTVERKTSMFTHIELETKALNERSALYKPSGSINTDAMMDSEESVHSTQF